MTQYVIFFLQNGEEIILWHDDTQSTKMWKDNRIIHQDNRIIHLFRVYANLSLCYTDSGIKIITVFMIKL